ncbi:MAG: hypothetical protein JWO36_6681 [Myxococcales bacterium]|nr:hypothetical protein [Myxococcales bacterium]
MIAANLWQWLSELRPLVILAAGWMLLVLYAFPGIMTMDSFDQLREGREWFFTDSHPPAMAALWGIVDRIVPGPIGMLAIHSTAFVSGLYLIFKRVMRPRRAAWCACAVSLFPPVLVPLAAVWKDCLMAGFLVLGTAAILDSRRSFRLVGLGCFVVATAMRYNAPAATLPLVLMLFEWLPVQVPATWRRVCVRYAAALAAWLAVTILAFGINAALTKQKMHFWHSSLAILDIVGTLANVDTDIPDDDLRPELAPTGILVDKNFHAAVRAKYLRYDFQQLVSGDGHLWDLPLGGIVPAPEAQRDAIERAWWNIVTAHPAAYLRHRLSAFGEALGMYRRFQGAVVVPHDAQYPGMLAYMGLGNRASRFQELGETATMFLAKKTRLFRPHVYALLSILLLGLCWRERLAAAILLSGIGAELSLLPLTQTPDYRYSHWMIVCTCIALIMLCARRMRASS